MREAWCYSEAGDALRCEACILRCEMDEGETGFCRARKNVEGKLYNTIHGKLSSFSIDYIEKAPLYHFHPNHKFLSLGSLGCNLRCQFCLAWNITQVPMKEVNATEMEAHCLVNAARALDCKGFVYTHSEPTLNMEYYAEIMDSSKNKDLVNVFATNGLLTEEAFSKISGYLDAVALTVKGSERFYREKCGAKARGIHEHLDNLVDMIIEKGIHLEIVGLVIPGYLGELSSAIDYAVKSDSPLILLRFFPCHAMAEMPSPTEEELERVLQLAYARGVKYAYLENIFAHPGKNTYCEVCRAPLVKREGFGIVEWGLMEGKCTHCGASIPIVGEKA